MSSENKSSILSDELEKAITSIVDSRIEIFIKKFRDEQNVINNNINGKVDKIKDMIEESLNRTEINELSRTVNKLKTRTQNIQYETSHDALEQMIARILYEMTPNFGTIISKEVKTHIASIALFALENSKEKE